MSMAKVSTYRAPDAIIDKRNGQLEREVHHPFDNVIIQATGREPFLSFSHPGDNSIQWIQLLNALEQQGTVKKGSRTESTIEENDREKQSFVSTSERHGFKESDAVKGCRTSARLGKSATEKVQALKIPEAVIAFAQAAAKANGLPGWPLLSSPTKMQLQKCEKCSKEFGSQINYRRHIRVHRRSLNTEKVSSGNREPLSAYWDKLSPIQQEDLASFEDVTLEDVSGSSISAALGSLTRMPGFSSLPHSYLKAGAILNDIVTGRQSVFPIASQELFSVLDDASENTFLCGGTAISLQKFVFDGEVGKIAMETRNLIASASFLLEQKLVKAWVADKDAEALRCQKLLFEEEEAAQKRQEELLLRKRLKKLRQREQKAKTENTAADEPDSESSRPCPTVTDDVRPAYDVDGDHDHESAGRQRSTRNGFVPSYTMARTMYNNNRDQRTAQKVVWTRKSKPPSAGGGEVLIGSITVTLKEVFSSEVAAAFLSQRWRAAVACPDAKLVISSEPKLRPKTERSYTLRYVPKQVPPAEN
ncbi:C2H2-like zinc finger protein isoform X2 [Wolffia australiana]